MAKTAKHEYTTAQRKRGKEFLDWLNGKGWTQDSFARDTGISVDTIRKWCGGTDPDNMARIVLRNRCPDCPLLVQKVA